MSTFKTTDNRSLYFEDTGTGKPLLCLSGLTRCSRDFSFFAPHAKDYRLITMDYRGRGQSEYDPDFRNYNVMRETHDVVELLDHLGLDKVTVLGTSRGGLIAMALAASKPERLSAVILNDIGPVVGAPGMARIMAYVGKKPVWSTYDEAALGLQTAMAAEFPDVTLETWRQQAEIQYEETADGLGLRYDAKLHNALLEQFAAGANPDLWLFFRALNDIPLGVLRGANSDILSHDTLEEMIRRHPDLTFAEVPNRGHVPFLNEPEALDIIHGVMDKVPS